MLTLSAADIARGLPMRDAIDVVAKAFAAISSREGYYPARIHMKLAQGDALVMPGFDGAAHLGVKIATIHPGNMLKGKPGTRASYMLIDAADGETRLLCDGTALTALRTGAASGLATRRLARADASTLAVFGAGTQAETQLAAMFTVRPIRDVRLVGRDRDRVERFIAAMRPRYPEATFERCHADAAIDGAHIIVTATNSLTPVFDGGRVDPGTHVNAVGSFRPDMRELDSALLRRSRLCVDQRDAALAEAGEIVEAIASGFVRPEHVVELGEIGECARATPQEITVFKTVGHAALDLYTAVELWRRTS